MTSEFQDLPPELQPVFDSAVDALVSCQAPPDGLEKIQEWLKMERRDALIKSWEDLSEPLFIRIEDVAAAYLHDDYLRDRFGIDDDVQVTDLDRINWGHKVLDDLESTGEMDADSYLVFPHFYPLTATNGTSVVISFLCELHGQAGPLLLWHGLYLSAEEFLESLATSGKYWNTSRMGKMPDEMILAKWQSPRMRKKHGK